MDTLAKNFITCLYLMIMTEKHDINLLSCQTLQIDEWVYIYITYHTTDDGFQSALSFALRDIEEQCQQKSLDDMKSKYFEMSKGP